MTATRDDDAAVPLDPELAEAVRRAAEAGTLLVASDFDGVLAPLVVDPLSSRPLPGSMELLAELAGRPGTHVALVSGRALGPLRELSGAGAEMTLIGSHGAEDSRRPDGLALDDRGRELLEVLDRRLADLIADHPRARLEEKPAGRVVHVRGLAEAEGSAALDAAAALGAELADAGLVTTRGKGMVELAASRADKGTALVALARDLGADAVYYAGDDTTDEHAFAALAELDGPHLTVHVGDRIPDGGSAARFHVADEEAALAVLRELASLRPPCAPRCSPAG